MHRGDSFARRALFTITFKSFRGSSAVHLRHHPMFLFKFVKCFLVDIIFLMRVYEKWNSYCNKTEASYNSKNTVADILTGTE